MILRSQFKLRQRNSSSLDAGINLISYLSVTLLTVSLPLGAKCSILNYLLIYLRIGFKEAVYFFVWIVGIQSLFSIILTPVLDTLACQQQSFQLVLLV